MRASSPAPGRELPAPSPPPAAHRAACGPEWRSAAAVRFARRRGPCDACRRPSWTRTSTHDGAGASPELARRRVGVGHHGAHFARALPALTELLVNVHEVDRRLDRFLAGLELENGVAADDFLGFSEGPVDHADFAALELYVSAHRQRQEAAAIDHRARLDGLLSHLVEFLEEPLGRRTRLAGFD